MGRPRKDPTRVCSEKGCGARIFFARRAGTDRFIPLEKADQTPYSTAAYGCVVVVAGEAWRPADLVEDVRVRNGLTESAATEFVAGQPWHRPHFHEAHTPVTNGAA